MRTEARFVKPDDYFNYFGSHLAEDLQVADNESNKVNIFLKNVESNLLSRIDKESFRIYDWEHLSPYQTECLQEAILLQAQYVIRNGDMMSDSGYEPERGFVASMDRIQNASVSPNAKDRLNQCGLWNHVIKNRRRYMKIGFFR